MKSRRFTYSVLVGKTHMIGLYAKLLWAKENAILEGGKVIRFINNSDGSTTLSGKYIVLKGKLKC